MQGGEKDVALVRAPWQRWAEQEGAYYSDSPKVQARCARPASA
jgi:hypothetical protein